MCESAEHLRENVRAYNTAVPLLKDTKLMLKFEASRAAAGRAAQGAIISSWLPTCRAGQWGVQ